MHKFANGVLKKRLKKLLTEKQYSQLQSVYNRGLPGFLSTLPDFIILGAMKCGTSSLYGYLSHHPQVIPASCKEVHFFDHNYEKGVFWYRKHFPSIFTIRFGQYITGEASPYYIYRPDVAERIDDILEEPKLIILLRDPVDRAISHYWHMVRSGRENLPMEQAFEKQKKRISGKDYGSYNRIFYSYLERGHYLEQIERFRNFFDKENILIIKSERLFEETQNTFDDVTNFLGIENHTLEDSGAKHKGSYKRETPQSVRSRLENYYLEQKIKLREELGVHFD